MVPFMLSMSLAVMQCGSVYANWNDEMIEIQENSQDQWEETES